MTLATKPDAKLLTIKEQIIEDPVSGLTFQFAVSAAEDAPFRLRIYGNLPNGNREILFNADGEEAGAGTALVGRCQATWIRGVAN